MAGNMKIPGAAIDPTGDDVLAPITEMLRGIDALGLPEAPPGSLFGAPAQSVAIIESGATALSKLRTTLLGLLGGATAITAAATRFWNNQQGGTRIAVVAATGAVIAATVIALGIIVSSDVRGRATGAAAIYHARARVAQKFLDASMAAKQTPALTCSLSWKSSRTCGPRRYSPKPSSRSRRPNSSARRQPGERRPFTVCPSLRRLAARHRPRRGMAGSDRGAPRVCRGRRRTAGAGQAGLTACSAS